MPSKQQLFLELLDRDQSVPVTELTAQGLDVVGAFGTTLALLLPVIFSSIQIIITCKSLHDKLNKGIH